MSKILTFGGYALTVGNNAVAASALNPYTPTLYNINYANTAGYFSTSPTPKSAYDGSTVTIDLSNMYSDYYLQSYELTQAAYPYARLDDSYYISQDPPVFKMPNSAIRVNLNISK